MPDLTVHVPPSASLAGISRFYDQVLGATTLSLNEDAEVEARLAGASADIKALVHGLERDRGQLRTQGNFIRFHSSLRFHRRFT